MKPTCCVVISSNYPIPPSRSSGEIGKYDFLKRMLVGDSFALEKHNCNLQRKAKSFGITLTIRQVPEGGFRCWRIK